VLVMRPPPKQLVDDPVLGEEICRGDPFKLAFVEHVHGFVTLNRPLCCGEFSKCQPRIHVTFHLRGVLPYDAPPTSHRAKDAAEST
jgi:hypothetical protein